MSVGEPRGGEREWVFSSASLLMGSSWPRWHHGRKTQLFLSPDSCKCSLPSFFQAQGPAPSFTVSLYPAHPFTNPPHLPKLGVVPVSSWDPNWYAEPRYFDWLTILVTGHNLESQWGHCFFQKILYKNITPPLPPVAERVRKLDPGCNVNGIVSLPFHDHSVHDQCSSIFSLFVFSSL